MTTILTKNAPARSTQILSASEYETQFLLALNSWRQCLKEKSIVKHPFQISLNYYAHWIVRA